MHKLMILIEQQEDWQVFESGWPEFLHLVETMPGLQREATSRIDRFLYGDCRVGQVHELFFNTLADAEKALASPQGQAAGKLIQNMTGGRMILFLADHKEDDLTHILAYKTADSM